MLNDSISNIRIDINGESARSGIYVRQGDTKSRSIHISLVDHGQVISLENAIVAELFIAKTDGFECDQGMVIVGNELQYTFRTNDLSALGANKAQVMVTFDDGAVLTSPEFTINVYAKKVNQKYQESQNEYTALTQNVALASQYATQAESSATKAGSYESAFVTMRNEAVTASENASASAASASESATTASGASAEATECKDVCLEAKSDALSSKNQANLYMIATKGYADQAIEASATASQSQIQAKASENNAKVSEDKADEYQQQAKSYLDEMSTNDYVLQAKAYSESANNYMINAQGSATAAADSKLNASNSATAAAGSASDAAGYASDADGYQQQAKSFLDEMMANQLVLGNTSDTAHRGDHGAAAYNHSLVRSGNPHNVTYAEVGADALGAAADALSRAQAYVDNAIAELINGAPTTLDTLKEIADAMAESQEVIDALDAAIGTKADVTALNNHVNNTNIHVTLQDKAKWDAVTALEQRILTLESMIGYPINPS